MRRPITIFSTILSVTVIACLGWTFYWQSIANTLLKKMHTELEAYETAIESKGGQFNYGTIQITGFPFAFEVEMKKLYVRHFHNGIWVSLQIPNPIYVTHEISKNSIHLTLPNLIQVQTNQLFQKDKLTYLLQSGHPIAIDFELPENWQDELLSSNQGLSNWFELFENVVSTELTVQSAVLSMSHGNQIITRQSLAKLQLNYLQQDLKKKNREQHQIKWEIDNFSSKSILNDDIMELMPYYHFLNDYLSLHQPVQLSGELQITGPENWWDYQYHDSVYQLKNFDIVSPHGKINIHSDFALFSSKVSPQKGNINIEVSNFINMTLPLTLTYDSILSLPMLQSYDDQKFIKPELPVKKYQAIFLQNLKTIGNESENGKSVSFLLQFYDKKILLQDDNVEKLLPKLLKPLKAIKALLSKQKKLKNTKHTRKI